MFHYFTQVKKIAREVADTPSIADEERLQLARLLSLRHASKSSRSPKLMAETLVRYIYLLLEHTTSLCRREGVSFEALRPHEQTLLLRCQANDLRALCDLPSCDLLFDPEDAEQVVRKLTRGAELSALFGLQNSSTAEVVSRMRTKYSTLLHGVPVSCQSLFELFGSFMNTSFVFTFLFICQTLENIAHLLKTSISILRQSGVKERPDVTTKSSTIATATRQAVISTVYLSPKK